MSSVSSAKAALGLALVDHQNQQAKENRAIRDTSHEIGVAQQEVAGVYRQVANSEEEFNKTMSYFNAGLIAASSAQSVAGVASQASASSASSATATAQTRTQQAQKLAQNQLKTDSTVKPPKPLTEKLRATLSQPPAGNGKTERKGPKNSYGTNGPVNSYGKEPQNSYGKNKPKSDYFSMANKLFSGYQSMERTGRKQNDKADQMTAQSLDKLAQTSYEMSDQARAMEKQDRATANELKDIILKTPA